MTQIYYVTLKIVVCFILGVILKRTGVTDTRAEKSISDILIKAVLPFMILASSQYVYDDEMVKSMIAVACYAAISYLSSSSSFKEESSCSILLILLSISF